MGEVWRGCPSSGIDPVIGYPVRLQVGPEFGGTSSYADAWLESCPSSGGIDPVRLLSPMFSRVRLARFPSSGGIDPVKTAVREEQMRECRQVAEFGRQGAVQLSTNEGAGRRLTRRVGGFLVIRVHSSPLSQSSHSSLRVARFPGRCSSAPQRALQSAMSPVFV